jgi:acetyl-CoA carboxylase alpha subunit
MDLHKDTHTAVMVNCWNEKLDVIVIENKPSGFNKLAKRVNKMAVKLGLPLIYGLENANGTAVGILAANRTFPLHECEK